MMDENKIDLTSEFGPTGKRAWLLTWSESKWVWEDYENACVENKNEPIAWSSSNHHPQIGDDVFLMKLSDDPKGVVAKGTVVKSSYMAPNFKNKDTNHIDVVFGQVRYYHREPILKLEDIKQAYQKNGLLKQDWDPQGSGITIKQPTLLWKMWDNLMDPSQGTSVVLQSGKRNTMSLPMAHNLILCGPPGTGKTYSTVIYAVDIVEGKNAEEIEEDLHDRSLDYGAFLDRFNAMKFNPVKIGSKEKVGQIAFTTFHQSYGYEEFIEGIRPKLDSGTIQYERKDGIFKAFCEEAAKPENKEERFVFIIDEINRGNISKIFGELITLIEDSKRAGAAEAMEAVLPYSQKSFSVPQNVYIIGTMNTADRSIAMMDTALRRRFSFVEMMPNTKRLETIKVAEVNIGKMLDVINERITYLYDREHTIGHAFFMGLKQHQDIEHLSEIFKKKIIPLLQEYFYDDYEKIRLVLGDNKKEEKYQFIKKEEASFASVFSDAKNEDEDDEKALFTIQDGKDGKHGAFSEIESYRQII